MEMNAENHGATAALLVLIEKLEGVRNAVADEAASRAGSLTGYAQRISERNGSNWASLCGVMGWLSSDTFVAGIASPHTARQEMERFAMSSKRGGNPIEHLVFSWPAEERHENETMLAAANVALEKAGFPLDCPRVLAVHNDTDNLHVHAVVSRYRPAVDQVWSRGMLIDALHKACRQVEQEFGFLHDNGNYVVTEGDEIVPRRYNQALLTAQASRFEHITGRDSLERYVRSRRPEIETALRESQDWDDFHELLACRFGLGIKRHGAGYVLTDLQQGKGAATKASLGGCGAPAVEAALGTYSCGISISRLRVLARSAEPAPPKMSPSSALANEGAAILSQRRKEKILEAKNPSHPDHLIRSDGLGNPAVDPKRRRREEQTVRERRKRERAAELHRLRLYMPLPRLTPAALIDYTSATPRSGSASLTLLGFSTPVLLLVALPGCQAIQDNGTVEYWRGGDVLLVDDGLSVAVYSYASADIEDAIAVLIARDPDARSRGILVSGDDLFREQAMRVISNRGLPLANQDPAMRLRFQQMVASMPDMGGTSTARLTMKYP
ncbi:TPA: relaxase/mobilization nuclease domain-containing protein [Pseudomonas aeruginosa]